jgi:hypothetical protein
LIEGWLILSAKPVLTPGNCGIAFSRQFHRLRRPEAGDQTKKLEKLAPVNCQGRLVVVAAVGTDSD